MPYREITDQEGRAWRVWDTYPGRFGRAGIVSDVLATGWLTFESPGEKRRLAPVPEGWEDQDPGGLLLLLAEAECTGREGPAAEGGEGEGGGEAG